MSDPTALTIPDSRAEDWRYADTKPLRDFVASDPQNVVEDPHGLALPHILFSNGVVALAQKTPAGIEITKTKEPLEFPGWAGNGDAVTVVITQDQEAPLQIQELINGSSHVTSLHIAIKAGVSAKVNIARLHQVPGKSGTQRTVDVARDANLSIHEFDVPVDVEQPTSVGISLVDKEARVAENGHLSYVTGTLGGVLVRHRYDIHIDGEHAEAVITGASILNGDRQAHHLVRLSHHVGNSNSQQTFTAVADDTSRSSFDGLVRVDAGADGTDAEQSNRNMALSPDARIATRPQLDVYADDVAAGHGATIGAPQEEEIAYLRTRGLTRDQARALLIQGFAREPLNEISDPHLREWATDVMLTPLRHRAGGA